MHWFTFNFNTSTNTSTKEVVNSHNCRDSSTIQDWQDPWDLDYLQGLQNVVDLICGRLALAILVTFFLTCQGAKMVIGQFSWGWHWRRRRSVSGVSEGGGWRPSRPPSNSPKPHHTPSPNIIQGRSLNCQLLAKNYSTQIKLLIYFKYQSVKQSETLFVCHYFFSLPTLLDFGEVTTK